MRSVDSRPACFLAPNSTSLSPPSPQDEEIDRIHETLIADYGAINYKAFTSLLVEITEDTSSVEQLRDAFREMARDKVRADEHLCSLVLAQ